MISFATRVPPRWPSEALRSDAAGVFGLREPSCMIGNHPGRGSVCEGEAGGTVRAIELADRAHRSRYGAQRWRDEAENENGGGLVASTLCRPAFRVPWRLPWGSRVMSRGQDVGRVEQRGCREGEENSPSGVGRRRRHDGGGRRMLRQSEI